MQTSPSCETPCAGSAGFTLTELVVVMGIIIALMVLVAPAVTGLKATGGVTKAAYDISGSLETARAYAMANNTYTWVGFFEESATQTGQTPAVAGTGNVVIGVVASRDGTTAYNPNSLADPDLIDPAKLSQLGKLIQIEGVHLASFPDGTGTGDTFATRPPAASDDARIGDANPPTSTQFPFQIPLSAATGQARYVFTKTIQFSPRGEATVNSTDSLQPTVEIGIQPAHGAVADVESKDLVAVQITGVSGNLAIYRP